MYEHQSQIALLPLVAGQILSSSGRMAELSEEISAQEVDIDYKFPGPEKIAALNALIVAQCADIARAVERILYSAEPVIPNSDKVATANDSLNQEHGDVRSGDLFEYGHVECGVIDELTVLFDDISSSILPILRNISESAPDFKYVFDIRNKMPVEHASLLNDLAKAVPILDKLEGFKRTLLKLVIAVNAQDVKRDFDLRERDYRDLISERDGINITEVVSYAKLLRDDFEKISELLREALENPRLLEKLLAVHYFDSVEIYTNPMPRSTALIDQERETPGFIGATYQERLKKYLEIFRHILIILNVINRTLLLLRCRK